MKRISLAFLLLFCLTTFAQDGINYKAIVKDASGNLIVNDIIAVQFIIYKGVTLTNNVYQETHAPTTDANGLVVLNIGEGTTVDTFSALDWGSDEHFLNVQINLGGGLVDMGTTQFMAVPYALHAATAGSVSNALWETSGSNIYNENAGNVGIGTTTAGHNLEVKADGQGFSQTTSDGTKKIGTYANTDGLYLQTHTDDALNFATNNSLAQITLNTNGDLGIGVTDPTAKLDIAGTIKIVDGTEGAGKVLSSDVSGNASWQTPVLPPTLCGLSIGDTHQGGIIFYLDASGCHGLIAAPTDQSTGIVWWNGSYVDTYAYGNGIGSGEGNSQGIRRWQGTCSSCYASELCQDLSLGGENDWYLPSKYELNLMYENIGQGNALGLGNIGSFSDSYYWSSTEFTLNSAWRQYFNDGNQTIIVKNVTHDVRAVRAF